METCNTSVINMSSLHSKAQLTNLRLFLWHAPIDEGLFVFNITSLTKQKIILPVIVRFELCSLYENKFSSLAIQVVMDAEVFGRKAAGLLAQQVSDYITSCFRFCESGRVDLGVVVFVADVVVDGHELEEKDVLSACRALARIDSLSFLHNVLEDGQEVIEDDRYQRIDESIVADDDELYGFSENTDDQEEQEYEGRSYSDYDYNILQVIREGADADYSGFLIRMDLYHDDDVNHNDVNYDDGGYVNFRNNPNEENNNDQDNIILGCSELEDFDDNNADEFNHVLNTLRSSLHHVEEEHSTKSTKVSQDYSVRKSLLKIKPTIELVKAEELSEDSMCSICLEEISSEGENIKMSRCKHVFHRDCIFKWLPKKQSCPYCRLSSLTDMHL